MPPYLSLKSLCTEKSHFDLWKQSSEWLSGHVRVQIYRNGECNVTELDVNSRLHRRGSKDVGRERKSSHDSLKGGVTVEREAGAGKYVYTYLYDIRNLCIFDPYSEGIKNRGCSD